MALWSEKIKTGRICSISHVEKRYLNSILNGDKTDTIELYCIKKR
jgi:hypothetical protein